MFKQTTGRNISQIQVRVGFLPTTRRFAGQCSNDCAIRLPTYFNREGIIIYIRQLIGHITTNQKCYKTFKLYNILFTTTINVEHILAIYATIITTSIY